MKISVICICTTAMDLHQEHVMNLAKNGHNIVMTGQAGSGKSHLVKSISDVLLHMNKIVAITCSTGIATVQYHDYGTKYNPNLFIGTLHKWSGVNDGRYQNEILCHLLLTDDKYSENQSNIMSADILIIDEISMISQKVFSQVEYICRRVRNKSLYFGGLQMIIVGDFFQLPPVINQLYGDTGKYCFELPWFSECFPHQINLKKIHRQDNPELIKLINELQHGKLSKSSESFISSLERPIEGEGQAIHLFSKNSNVDIFNYTKVMSLPGELKIYNANDQGSLHYIKTILAPKKLGLKPNCDIVLLKNLSSYLVNGLRGKVLKCLDKSVIALFSVKDKSVSTEIGPATFSVFDPVQNMTVAKRSQLPIKPSYAMTIHKSQGMSLDKVVIHCDGCFLPGQLGVAVGRATNAEGLQMVGFKKSQLKPHPECVYSFYGLKPTIEIKDNLSCCREVQYNAPVFQQDLIPQNEYLGNDCEDFSDSEISFIEDIDCSLENSGSLPDKMIEIVFELFTGTPKETLALVLKQNLKANFTLFSTWVNSQEQAVQNILSQAFSDFSQTNSKQVVKFYSLFHSYMSSNVYRLSTTNLISNYSASGNIDEEFAYQFLTSVTFQIQQHLFTGISERLTPNDPVNFKPHHESMAAPAKGKIRYIGGYVVAKTKHNLSKKVQSLIFCPNKESLLNMALRQLNLISLLCVNYQDISETSEFPDTLEETRIKQNVNEGLTNISDQCFLFFMFLSKSCHEEMFGINPDKNLFQAVKTTLKSRHKIFEIYLKCFHEYKPDFEYTENDNLQSQLSSCMSTILNYAEDVNNIFDCVLDLFLKVSISQFRRDYLCFLKKEKGKSLRKKVMQKGGSQPQKFNVTFIKGDNSEDRISSHLRLKSELISNKSFLGEKNFNKNELLVLCKAYGVVCKGSEKKEVISQKLTATILASELFVNPEELPKLWGGPLASYSEMENQHSVPSSSRVVTEDMIEPRPSSSHDTNSYNECQQSLECTANTCIGNVHVTKQTRGTKRKSAGGKGKLKGKCKGKSKKIQEDNDSELCSLCYKSDNGEEEWVSCDICYIWYHRKCVGISDSDWKALNENKDIQFSCIFCN